MHYDWTEEDNIFLQALKGKNITTTLLLYTIQWKNLQKNVFDLQKVCNGDAAIIRKKKNTDVAFSILDVLAVTQEERWTESLDVTSTIH